MIEIKLLTDSDEIKKLNAGGKSVMAARENGEIIAYSVFVIEDGALTLERIVPENDALMADAIIRSTLFIALNRNISKVYYSQTVDEALLKRLKLVKDDTKKLLDIEILFKDCSCK